MKIAQRLQDLSDLLAKNKLADPLASKLIEKISFEINELERQIDILTLAGSDIHKEKEQQAIMEIILNSARKLTNADGGTLYMVEEEYSEDHYNPGEIKSRKLQFEVLQNDTMGVYLKRTASSKIFLPPVPLEIDGKPNQHNVSAHCAITGEIINIEDVYHARGFDFSGTKKYDATTGYRSKSMLVLPLRNHQFDIIGVMQLINRQTATGEIIPFTSSDLAILQAISYQAAVTLTTQILVQEQVDLFNSFVQVLAEGLGEKAAYHYGHINRVAGLTLELAQQVSQWEKGIYGQVTLSQAELSELKLAGWMHDIGKLTTPENVVSKQLKLERVSNRMELIIERTNSKIKDLEIAKLQAQLKTRQGELSKDQFQKESKKIDQKKRKLVKILKNLNRTNFGGEFLEEATKKEILEMAELTHKQWIGCEKTLYNGTENIKQLRLLKQPTPDRLINEEEKECLLIQRGTLTAAERQIVNDHADRSWRWLFKLPFPKKMKKLPLFAAAHHETLSGSGYPIGLKAEQLPLQARIIAIADIFEALTASDRPYKQPMKLSKALEILGFMVKEQQLDAEIVKIFLESGLYQQWAAEHLKTTQIDEINASNWIERFYPSGFPMSLPEFQKELWELPSNPP